MISYRSTGDQNILAALFLRYHEMLYGVAVKYLNDQDAAKDAVLDVYTQLVTKLKQHDPENFRAWVYVVTKNHCLMQLRRQKQFLTKEITESDVYSELSDHPVDAVLKEKKLNSLEDCMEELGDEQKQVIKQFYLEELSYNDIAAATGFDWNKVRSLVQNGRRNLKICMEKNEAE